MLKLYKMLDNQLFYWETWEKDEKTAIVHWGAVGHRGQDKEIGLELFPNFREIVQKEIDEKIQDGYAEFDEDDMAFLEVVYNVEGFGTDQDLEKRHRLESRLNSLLGWTGLGHVDGGSIGGGTMEAGCMVVDYDIAKQLIEDHLKYTEFGDFATIYRMGEE